MATGTVQKKDISIFVVDDDTFVLDAVCALLRDYGCSVFSSDRPQEAVETLSAINVNVVLADVKMPRMNGIELLDNVRMRDPDIPVILMTAYADLDVAINAMQKGAFDFLIKPFGAEYLFHAVDKAAEFNRLRQVEKRYKKHLEDTVQTRDREIKEALQMVKNMSREVIQRLTAAAEFRDSHTGTHIIRMGLYASKIAAALKMSEDYIETITFASLMHDIGKIGIPDNILLKSEALTDAEFEIMKTHTIIGEKILSGSSHRDIQMAASIALNHHERWDGSGYPNGLSGEAIPLEGRIVIICDQYDALMSKRPYKSSLSQREVLGIITKGDGRTMPGHFDPGILEAFLGSSSEFEEIYSTLQD